MSKPNQIRIIGGQWRGRLVNFADSPETALRPTPNRVRETLFNWLSSAIVGARCLDAFGGSGALGFEALSRGAKHVTMIESCSSTVNRIQENASLFKIVETDSCLRILCQNALDYLAQTTETFDIIFLDPPFQANLLISAMQFIADRKLLHPKGYLYTENAALLPSGVTDNAWIYHRSKRAGGVYYNLFKPMS